MALLKFKRSAVPAKVPALNDLALGELAINTYDGKVYTKKDDGTPAIVEIGGNSSGITTITSTDGSVTVTGSGATRDLSVAVAGSTTNVLALVRNNTGATLAKGTVVYINGSLGQNSTVAKAIANSDATSAQTLGLMTANLANNATGYVTVIGVLTGMDTSAFTDGQQLYLSPTTAGTFTATKPYAPQHLVYVAVVEHAHPTQGKLFVKVQNGYEMDELHDVSAQNPANNDGLFYNTTSGLWEKKSIATALGYTPANKAGDTFTGVVSIYNSNDAQLYLNGNGTSWAGISWADVSGTDYMWYNGSTSTFAIGGGGSFVANKKLHVHGGMTIGSGIAASASGTNSLLVEASITANQIYGQIFYDSQNGAYYVDPASTSNLNKLTASNRSMVGNASIFMSDLDANTYYPVTIPIPVARQTTLRIENALNSNAPSWSTHPSGFSCYIEWTTNGLGWGTIPISRRVTDWREQFATVQIVGGITQLGNGSTEVIWLRGGANYFFSADCDVTPTIRTTLYDLLGQTVEPRSSPFNNPRETATGRVAFGSLQTNEQSLFRGNIDISTGSPQLVFTSTTSGRAASFGMTDAYNMYLNAPSSGVLFLSEFRAPIMRDSDDSGYYIDPNSTSRLYYANVNFLSLLNDEGLNVKGIRGQFSAGSDGQGISLFSNVDIGYPSGWGSGLGNTPSRGLSVYGGLRVAYSGTGFVTSDTSVRSPIFYDSNNTGYYVDPNGNSFIYGLSINVGQEATGAANSSVQGLVMRGNYNSNTWAHKFHKFDNGNGVPLYLSRTFGDGAWTGVQGWGTGLSYLSQVFGSFGADSVYSPIFYDSDNTAYYADLTTTGIGIKSAGEIWCGIGIDGDGVRINHDQIWTPAGNFHIQYSGGGNIDMCNGGGFAFSRTSYRAPIFYDNDNTAYYFDGTGGTRQSKFLTINGNTGGNNGNELVVGNTAVTYSLTDTNLRPIIQAHGAYPVLSLNHTITANTLHGPTVQFTANGTGKQFVIGMSGNGSQLDIGNSAATDWNPHNGIGGYNGITGWRMDGAGNVYNLISSRSPIYYDNNDTGYYIDPTGTSFTNVMRGFAYQSLYGGGQPAARWDCSFYVLQSQHWYSHNGASTMYIGESGDFVYIRGYTTAEGSSRAPIYYDSTNTAYYWNFADGAISNINTTIVGLAYFTSNRNTSSSNPPLQAFSNDGGGAIMSFHRAGYFAVNMGLDSDNVFRIGGWSAGGSLLQLDMSGNLTMAGNVTAYSDARLKKDVKTITGALDTVGKMRGVTYTRIDTDKAGVGVIAQEMLEVMPQVVHQGVGDDDTLSVAYGNLVGVLIEAIKELSLKVKTLEEKDN